MSRAKELSATALPLHVKRREKRTNARAPLRERVELFIPYAGKDPSLREEHGAFDFRLVARTVRPRRQNRAPVVLGHFIVRALGAGLVAARFGHAEMRIYKESRRALFLRMEKDALSPLPQEPYVVAQFRIGVRVNLDYHVEFEGHFYSAPHALIHERVDIRATEYVIKVLHRGQRVASHMRSSVRGKHTTFAAHMPKAHQKHLEWTPSRIVRWAESIGPKTLALAEAILAERKHPEQGYRSCLGIFRLGKKYSPERLEAACSRALDAGARSYRHVESILRHGLDRVDAAPLSPRTPFVHENVRGRTYYN